VSTSVGSISVSARVNSAPLATPNAKLRFK
jgi:hypothetical protein